MLRTKSFKIILGALATLMFVLAIAFGVNVKSARADSSDIDYLTLNNATHVTDVTDSLEFDVTDGASIEFNNSLVLNNLAFELSVQNVSKIELTFNTPSYDVNGEVVEHKAELAIGSALVFDGVTSTSVCNENVNLYFNLNKFSVGASLDKTNFVYGSQDKQSENIDKCIAKDVKLTFTAGDNAKVNLISVDQDYTNAEGVYKQSFNKVSGETIKKASARVSLANVKNLFVLTDEGYKLQIVKGTEYTLSASAYSVMGNDRSATYYVDKESFSGEVIANDTYPKNVVYRSAGTHSFTIQCKNKTSFEKYSFDVIDGSADTVAPTYNTDSVALANFKAQLQEAITIEENGNTYSIRLGEKVKIPSLKNLVTDDVNAYSDLKYKVYYSTPSSSNKTTSSLEFTVEEAGEYYFYVIFNDNKGNALEKEDFINDDNTAPYKDFVFSFIIKDDAPISVTSIKQDNGYIGTTYRASEFTIKYKGYTPSYKLYYNPVKDAIVGDLSSAEGWIEIPASAGVKETDTFEGISYDRIKDVAYNGALVFKPDAVGKYVIKCTVTSKNSVRTAEAFSEVVVEKAQTTVKPASDWLENNVWSVVFLGVGTLCLIGIVVLLCIKPKDKKYE